MNESAVENPKTTVAIVYHYFAHYREPVLNELAESVKYKYEFISDDKTKTNIKILGQEYFDALSRDHPSTQWVHVKNYWLGPLLWQRGLLKQAMRKEIRTFIFLGDAFLISTWFASLIARMSGKRVFFWTHGLYGRESKPKLWYRLTFYRLASAGLFLYGNYAKKLLIEKGFGADRLYNIYNSLDYQQQRKLREGLDQTNANEVRQRLFGDHAQLPIAFFVGRLTPEKKLGMLIDAFLQLHAEGQKINLLLIGSGPVESELRNSIPSDLQSHVKFFGACHDENVLAEMIYASDVCASPGNIGLTAMHSLAYGTPVVTHDDGKWQGPEFEAIQDGFNGSLFDKNDADGLLNALRYWLFDIAKDRDEIRRQCYQNIDKFYRPENQARIIELAIDGVPASKITPCSSVEQK